MPVNFGRPYLRGHRGWRTRCTFADFVFRRMPSTRGRANSLLDEALTTHCRFLRPQRRLPAKLFQKLGSVCSYQIVCVGGPTKLFISLKAEDMLCGGRRLMVRKRGCGGSKRSRLMGRLGFCVFRVGCTSCAMQVRLANKKMPLNLANFLSELSVFLRSGTRPRATILLSTPLTTTTIIPRLNPLFFRHLPAVLKHT